MRIAFKITLAVTLWTLLVLVGYAHVRLDRELQLLEDDLVREQQLIGRALRPSVEHAWVDRGIPMATSVVREASESERVVSIRAVALQRPIPGLSPPKLEASRVRKLMSAPASRKRAARDAKGHLVSYVALSLPEAPPAALELSVSLDVERRFVRRTLIELAVIGLLIGVCSFVLAGVLGWTLVGRRVGSLVRMAQAVGAGQDPPRHPVRRRDELGVLTHEMNHMADLLAASREQAKQEAVARSQLSEQLRHADRLATIGMLLSRVAHDIGTPLNVISARAKRIARGQVTGQAAADNARIASEEADQIGASIRNLLDFSRSGTGMRTRVAAGQVAGQVLDMLRTLASGRHVQLEVRDLAEGVELTTDAHQLQQALTNLVVNAVQASSAGGRVRLRVEPRRVTPPPEVGTRELEAVCFAVEDQGLGVPETMREDIYRPFFTTKPAGQGTGLGLAIASSIVRDLGGWITLETGVERGSRFEVWIPLNQA